MLLTRLWLSFASLFSFEEPMMLTTLRMRWELRSPELFSCDPSWLFIKNLRALMYSCDNSILNGSCEVESLLMTTELLFKCVVLN